MYSRGGGGDSSSSSSSSRATEIDSAEGPIAKLVHVVSFAAQVHMGAAVSAVSSIQRARRLYQATRAAGLLVEHGTTDVRVLTGALLCGVLDYSTTNPRTIEDKFGSRVLLTVAQTAEDSTLSAGARLRAHALNMGAITPHAVLVLMASLSADFMIMLEERSSRVSFRRVRYHGLWLRSMLCALDNALPLLRAAMLDQLNGSVIWHGAPRHLRLNSLAALHGSAKRAIGDYYMALDRQWPLNDTPSDSGTETSSVASDSSRLRSHSGASAVSSASGSEALRSKSLSPLARSRRPRRTRTDSAP